MLSDDRAVRGSGVATPRYHALLFIIYINDLPEVVQSNIVIFADNTCTKLYILILPLSI